MKDEGLMWCLMIMCHRESVGPAVVCVKSLGLAVSLRLKHSVYSQARSHY